MSRLRPNTNKIRNQALEKAKGVAQRRKGLQVVTLKSPLNRSETKILQLARLLIIFKVSMITLWGRINSKTILWRKSRLHYSRNIVWPNLRNRIIWITQFWVLPRVSVSAHNLDQSLNLRSRDDWEQGALWRRHARIQNIRRVKRQRLIWNSKEPLQIGL